MRTVPVIKGKGRQQYQSAMTPMFDPDTHDAYQLLFKGALTLADVEGNGMRVDTAYCEKQTKQLEIDIVKKEKELQKTEEVRKWKIVYGKKFNFDSDEQLADILFNHLGYEPKVKTSSGNLSVSQEALEQLSLPIVESLIELRRLKKAKTTYIKNYIIESVDGLLHPFFHLHTVVTYRSSSSKINFQNQPVRIPMIKKLVRQAVIPRDGHLIGEIDFSGVEVSIAACYHHDPRMIQDIIDPARDMHRDMSMECYKLGPDEWTKNTRYSAKNKFVFPQFYGDYYVNCARNLWDAIKVLKLETKAGVPLAKHLKKKGIGTYSKFENHIKRVEDSFWNERYGVYNQWKKDHWEQYLQDGYVSLKTGFKCRGVMRRNEAINYPVQGAAFHCLLWCLIRLNEWLKRNNFKTKIIGQIHDSIVLDIHPRECNAVLKMANKIMTVDILRHWDWVIVPLQIEAELTPVNGSWLLKKEVTDSGPKCKCGQNYLYMDETKTAAIYSCPVCSRKQEVKLAA